MFTKVAWVFLYKVKQKMFSEIKEIIKEELKKKNHLLYPETNEQLKKDVEKIVLENLEITEEKDEE